MEKSQPTIELPFDISSDDKYILMPVCSVCACVCVMCVCRRVCSACGVCVCVCVCGV